MTVAELSCGRPLAEALRSLRARVPGSEIATLCAAIERSRRFGSPLAEQLRRQSSALRRDQRRAVEERAARAAPKIQLVVALVLVPSVLLMIAAALIANADILLSGFWLPVRLAERISAPSVRLARWFRLLAQAAGDGGRGGADRVELGGRLLVAVDVAAEGAADQLEGELLRRLLGEPDDEGGGEELAQPDLVLLLAGEDLVALVERLALQLRPAAWIGGRRPRASPASAGRTCAGSRARGRARRTRAPRPGRPCSGSSWSGGCPRCRCVSSS